jgi:hypothetical protein
MTIACRIWQCLTCELAGPIAAGWYGIAACNLTVTGVTGTNGKTSCSQWLARLLQMAGTRCATIGTLGSGFPDALKLTGFTTPDACSCRPAWPNCTTPARAPWRWKFRRMGWSRAAWPAPGSPWPC